MGLDFDIIDDKGQLIDRFGIKWLYHYNNNKLFINNDNNNDIKKVILYCDEQIKILKFKVDENEKIKNLEFVEKKEYLSNLINNTNNDEELYELIEKIHNKNEDEDANIDYYLLERFNFFKSFLEKNIMYQCEISC